MNDLFDTVTRGNTSPNPESAAPEPVVEEKNQVLAEEGAAAKPELTGTEAEYGTNEEGEEENAVEESGENAAGDEIPAAASGNASTAAGITTQVTSSVSGTATAAPEGLTCLKEVAAGRPVACLSSRTNCQALSASSRLM